MILTKTHCGKLKGDCMNVRIEITKAELQVLVVAELERRGYIVTPAAVEPYFTSQYADAEFAGMAATLQLDDVKILRA